MPSISLTAKDRLRRSQSARSMRRSRQSSLPSEPFDPSIARQHAAVAATRAMLRSSDRSSADSKHSYDRLGGPESMAVPSRRPPHPPRHTQAPAKDPSVEDASPSRRSIASYIESRDDDLTFSAALPPISEFRGLDGRDSSLPSSYRRLRKARSMFSTRQRSSYISHEFSSDAYARRFNDTEQFDTSRSYRTLRHSMSFLKSGQSPRTVRHAQSQEAAIQLARSQFQENMVGQSSGQRQSSITMLKPRREHKPFRKTFRTNSGSGMDTDASPSAGQSKRVSSRGKARALSSSIKRGLKRVLGLSKTSTAPGQAEASPPSLQQHDYGPSSTIYDGDFSHAEEFDHSRETIGQSRPPTVRSLRSNESLATSRSRVTSWADSTVANTIATRRAPECDCLSIINEQGDFNGRAGSELPPRPSPIRPDGSIDSKHLYDALLRRIGREDTPSPSEEVVVGQVKEHRLIPARTSSLRPRRSRQTIRQIPSDASIATSRTFATANAGSSSPQKQTQRHSRSSMPSRRISSARKKASATLDFSAVGNAEEPAAACAEDAEDDSRSVIVASQADPETLSNSPSIYSRTTSGNSPERKDQTIDLYSSETEDEPGMVTIYESQRTAYSSPKRIARSSSSGNRVRPSAEWKQWMSSQMARFETIVPPRDHYREDAQIHEEAGDFLSSAPRQVSENSESPYPQTSYLSQSISEGEKGTDGKVVPSNNFSRPFSRSSSVRTIVPSRNEHAKEQASPSADSVFSSPSVHNYSQGYTLTTTGVRTRENEPALSPMQARSSNRLQTLDSPTPKRRGADSQQTESAGERYRRYSARRLTVSSDSRTQQCRSIRRTTNENARACERPDKLGPFGDPHDMPSPVSSKHMVEMFLSSRRRQIESKISEDGAQEGAFV
ncbi:uncharacterized protein NFIA_079600 [Aspergillus fischeri NRRL 181]|uniref:Uncharacterized protein n=1 Tax=Neosartorya fischeri (strain ATCC 1020 / DSM 3700 / CBS 544.65 / FGSC A1164 / JCM 1740 / NRRL 181 / WB 181) TaxID=331117 RepID=A1DF62_NEOFI|nr:conserved hypothetical protein [Aspergillus fischeri NRRL 181]EAW18019.1 conserved hypothetical protein [Aspergillus fischeri NRRL 181]KAG2016709.1 hypothetical protein GB937_006189 [Aspergillus fischeri]